MKKIEAFFIGIITALGALVFQVLISVLAPVLIKETLTGISLSMLIIIFIEEFFKLAVIWKTSQKYSLKKEIFLNSLIIGVGFSLAEIFLNILSFSISLNLLFASYLGLLLIHTTTSGIFGLYFSRKFNLKISVIILILLFANLLHFFYNFSVAQNFNYLIINLIFLILLFLLYFSTVKD